MATPQRLPIVNSDDGTWGDIIRQYLKKEHYDDGTDNAVNGGHQNVTIRAGSTTQAPLTFTSGPILTTPVAGAMEFNTDTLYFTKTTGTTRAMIPLIDAAGSATGDIYYRNASGVVTRLGIGSTGQGLVAAGGVPVWGNAMNFTTASKTASYTMTSTDTVIFADATSSNVTITLPAASGLAGYRFYVKRIDASATNTVTIARTGTDTIDGMTSLTMDAQYTAITVVSSGSLWYIL